jgi:hypothetical protein
MLEGRTPASLRICTLLNVPYIGIYEGPVE